MSAPDWNCRGDPIKQKAFADFVIRELERIEEATVVDNVPVHRLLYVVAANAAHASRQMTEREWQAEMQATKRGRGRPRLADQGKRQSTPIEMAARDVERMRSAPDQIFNRVWQRRNREADNPPSAEAIAADRHGVTERQVINRLKKLKTLRPI